MVVKVYNPRKIPLITEEVDKIKVYNEKEEFYNSIKREYERRINIIRSDRYNLHQDYVDFKHMFIIIEGIGISVEKDEIEKELEPIIYSYNNVGMFFIFTKYKSSNEEYLNKIESKCNIKI